MKITHLQSATQIIHLGDTKVLVDPWLTDGEYYGSWYHYPPFPANELNKLEYDYIYVSHIHPDHLSEATFKALPRKAPVLMHNYDSKFVKRKIEMLGYEAIECDNGEPFILQNGGAVTIYAADNCNPELCTKFLGCAPVEKKFGSTQIDSLVVFEHEGEVILNTNDCPFELAETAIISNELHKKNVDVLLVGYSGTGPYPQCFEFETEDKKTSAAQAKGKQFLNQAVRYIELVKPRCYVPFAGSYVLGSRLANLTGFTGVPPLIDALSYLDSVINISAQGLILDQFDELYVSSLNKKSANKHFDLTYEEYIEEISKEKLTYDDDSWDDKEIPQLVSDAYNRFKAKAEEVGYKSEIQLIIESDKVAFALTIKDRPTFIDIGTTIQEPFLKISLSHNLLHRVLRGPRFAHWNNAEIGSHLHYVRQPNVFERGLYHSLCFFHQ